MLIYDDTSLTLDGSPNSLFAALDTLDFFSKFSGLKINCSKTKIIWIGSKKFSSQVFHHSRWKLDWGSTTFFSPWNRIFCRIRQNCTYEL